MNGAPDDDGTPYRRIVNSPLEMYLLGNDPNVGRVIGAVGSCPGNHIENGDEAEALQSSTLRSLEVVCERKFDLSLTRNVDWSMRCKKRRCIRVFLNLWTLL